MKLGINQLLQVYMGVSKNMGTPKSSILIGFSIINHPFWGTPIFGNTNIETMALHPLTSYHGALLDMNQTLLDVHSTLVFSQNPEIFIKTATSTSTKIDAT